MKLKILLIALVVVTAYSCSSDKENDTENNDPNAIIGTWDAAQLETEDSSANFQKQILAHLTERDCYVLTFTFTEDSNVVAENAVNDLEINATENGLDIPCPQERSSETSTYTYDGQVLTIQDFNGQALNAVVTIEGDRMALDAEDLDIPNFDYAGKLIFRKR